MPVKDKAELVGAAGSGAYAISQLLEAYQSEKHHGENTTEHVAKAAVASAIAVGLYEMSKHAHAHAESEEEHEHFHHNHDHHNGPQHYFIEGPPKKRGTEDWTDEEESGHKRRLVEEAAAAYALGRRMMGEKNHPIATVIAEGLGAIALLTEGKKHLADK